MKSKGSVSVQRLGEKILTATSIKFLVFSFSAATGHYTQLVWAETDRLGCGTVYYMVTHTQA